MKKYSQFILILVVGISCVSCGKQTVQPKKNGHDGEVVYNKIEYTGTANLSVARIYMAAASAGNKILIAGGVNTAGDNSNVVDIYDVSSNSWSASKLSKLQGAGLGAVTTGKKIIFSDRATAMEIYDVDNGAWKVITLQLSVQRSFISLAAAGGKVFFAGGYTREVNNFAKFTDAVDIYDIATDTWSVGQPLNYPRVCSTVGFTANKVVFGSIDPTWFGPAYHGNFISKTNDVYTVEASGAVNGTIVEALLNMQDTPAGTNGNYILFLRWLYNANDDSFTYVEYDDKLSPGYSNTVAGAGTKFIVGLDFTPNIDVYDMVSKTWTTIPTGATRARTALAVAGNKVLLAGGVVSGNDWIASNKVDIFTLSAGK